jgi:hypothetical protein
MTIAIGAMAQCTDLAGLLHDGNEQLTAGEGATMSKKGGNKTSKAAPKPPMANKGPKKK